ncbi:MAG: hypothetical protein ACI94Y_000386 [Maribacter sp.]|jgi:hypothetical protein
MKKKILIGVVAVLIIMQFFRIDKTAPPHDPATDIITMTGADTEMISLLKGACYDCHSYDSKYPWYTNVAPFSFLIKGHIKGGRQNVNFAEWASYDIDKRKYKIEECIEVIEDGRMPMKSYTWLHPEAKLTDEQRNKLTAWMKSVVE